MVLVVDLVVDLLVDLFVDLLANSGKTGFTEPKDQNLEHLEARIRFSGWNPIIYWLEPDFLTRTELSVQNK